MVKYNDRIFSNNVNDHSTVLITDLDESLKCYFHHLYNAFVKLFYVPPTAQITTNSKRSTVFLKFWFNRLNSTCHLHKLVSRILTSRSCQFSLFFDIKKIFPALWTRFFDGNSKVFLVWLKRFSRKYFLPNFTRVFIIILWLPKAGKTMTFRKTNSKWIRFRN